jgi:tRNA-Thr(GGU) m(6)t(6)A37 methyltransferase TsaA
MMRRSYQIKPVGVIRKKVATTQIEIYPEYADALSGLDQFSHIIVLYWFHENDTPERRNILQVHPCANKKNPLTGVFGTHSPVRPNPIAFSLCSILSINGNRVTINDIDAFDGSPIIDIKSYFPVSVSDEDVRMPNWETKDDQVCRS